MWAFSDESERVGAMPVGVVLIEPGVIADASAALEGLLLAGERQVPVIGHDVSTAEQASAFAALIAWPIHAAVVIRLSRAVRSIPTLRGWVERQR